MKNLIKDLANKKILILGFGKEGNSTYKWLRSNFSNKQIGIADYNTNISSKINDTNVTLHTGDNYLESIKNYDLVFKSPGISLKNYTCENIEKITSQTDKFLEFYGKQTIGITGTKGKSTTASLIYHILKNNGKDAVLLGNIGIPAFDLLDKISENTIVVYELSAHQLEYVHHSPKIAVLLNVFPEHLDHFTSFEDYQNAKLNINRFQNTDDILIVSTDLKQKIKNTKLEINFIETEKDFTESPLKGEHNLKNINAAVQAVETFGINKTTAFDTLKSFKPLPHRLEYIGKYGGIHFYNDSIATVPEATIEAVKAIGEVNTIILGGFDRGLDYAEMLCFLRDNDKIKNLIFTGKAGEIMYKMISTQPKNGKEFFFVKNMEEVFEVIKKYTPENSVCLLSPAAASYDMYHNFEHRGNKFKELAKMLEK